MDIERLELLNEDAQVELYLFILGILAADETAAPAWNFPTKTKKVATEVTTTIFLIYKQFTTQLLKGKVF